MYRFLSLLWISFFAFPAFATTQTLSTTFTFDGDSGGTTASVDVQYEQLGDWVRVTLPSGVLGDVTGSLDGTPSTVLTANAALPSGYLPASAQAFTWAPIYVNGLPTGTVGYGEVSTAGVISLWKSSSKAAWSNSSVGNSGVGQAFTLWYYSPQARKR